MFRHGECSTETDRGPFLFTLAAFVGSLTAAVLLFVLGAGHPLSVFAGILVGVVAAASGAVLFAMTSDRAYIQDDTLFMRYMFRRAQIPLEGIGRLAYRDDVYSVYDRKDNLVGTINAKLTGIERILYKLDERGIRSA